MIRTMVVKDCSPMLADMCRLTLTLNDAEMWGHPAGTLQLTRFFWQKQWVTAEEFEYHVELEIEDYKPLVVFDPANPSQTSTLSGQYDRACWFNIRESVEVVGKE